MFMCLCICLLSLESSRFVPYDSGRARGFAFVSNCLCLHKNDTHLKAKVRFMEEAAAEKAIKETDGQGT